MGPSVSSLIFRNSPVARRVISGFRPSWRLYICFRQGEAGDGDNVIVPKLTAGGPAYGNRAGRAGAGRDSWLPANYHVLIEDGYVSLTLDEPVRFSRPSIDVMFALRGQAASRPAAGADEVKRSPERMKMARVGSPTSSSAAASLWCRTRERLRFRLCPWQRSKQSPAPRYFSSTRWRRD